MTLLNMLEDRYTMQSHNHTTPEDKFVMNFGSFDPENIFNAAHMGVAAMGGSMSVGVKRSAQEAGLDRDPIISSDDDAEILKKEKIYPASSSRESYIHHPHTSLSQHVDVQQKPSMLPNGKKTKGRVKIKMEFIDNKLRRYTTFSKRKTGIMKKAYELSTLTGTQVMLLVASETGHVYTFATRKLQPMITSEAGKALIQTCLNSPDPPSVTSHHHHDQRMSATGYEEPELTYAVSEDEHKVRQMMTYGSPLNTMHQQSPQIASPHHQSPTLGIQSHHHPQYPGHPPSSNHMNTPPTSTHGVHHIPNSQASHVSDHTNMTAISHHPSHIVGPATPLPSQSPLPAHSPMGTNTSPGSPYASIHHHSHHSIPPHSR